MRADAPYIIVYTGDKNDYTGTGAFAATDRPDELLDFLTDVLETQAVHVRPNQRIDRAADRVRRMEGSLAAAWSSWSLFRMITSYDCHMES